MMKEPLSSPELGPTLTVQALQLVIRGEKKKWMGLLSAILSEPHHALM